MRQTLGLSKNSINSSESAVQAVKASKQAERINKFDCGDDLLAIRLACQESIGYPFTDVFVLSPVETT